MSIINVNGHTFKVNTEAENIEALTSEFASRGSAWDDINNKFRTEYLPSAMAHYYTQGNIGPLNNMVKAVRNAKGLGVFMATLKVLSAHTWDESKERFVRNPDRKKYMAKVKKMTAIDKATGAPRWAVVLGKHLDREQAISKKNENLSFADKALMKLQAVHNMYEKAASDEDKAILAPLIDSIDATIEGLRKAKEERQAQILTA